MLRRRSVVFLVSDFLAADFEKPLAVAGRRHDLVAIRIGDERETEVPPIGLVEFEDPETGEHITVNTSERRFREAYERITGEARVSQDQALRKSKVDVIDIQTGRPYVQPLMRFFKERERRFR